MTKEEIKIGVVYFCKGGWYRRPVEITDAGPDYTGQPYKNVRYELGRTPDVDRSLSEGPLPWSANSAYHEAQS